MAQDGLERRTTQLAQRFHGSGLCVKSKWKKASYSPRYIIFSVPISFDNSVLVISQSPFALLNTQSGAATQSKYPARFHPNTLEGTRARMTGHARAKSAAHCGTALTRTRKLHSHDLCHTVLSSWAGVDRRITGNHATWNP